jgi:prepilin-type N-terminal cleavage/methylation domain-containing protein
MKKTGLLSKLSAGFTLIELLIVVAIIAILAAIAIVNYQQAQVKSKVSRAKSDIRSLATGLEAYAVDNTTYCPACIGMDGWQYNFGYPIPIHPRIQRLAWITTPIAYISKVPNDPFGPGKQDRGDDSDYRRGLNYQFPVYAYWDKEYIDSLKILYPAAWLDFPELFDQPTYWALMSYSPDRDMEAATGNMPVALICYDPSNGTTTNGDIWLFSGGYTR